MIENQLGVGAGVRQLRRIGNLAMAHAEIKAHPQLTDEANALDKLIAKAMTRGGRADLQDSTYTLDLRSVLEGCDVIAKTIARRPARNHRAFHRVVITAAHLDDVFSLLDLLRRRHVNLHVDRLDDIESAGGLEVIGHQKILRQWFFVLGPGQVELAEVPHVLMRIDDGYQGCLSSPRWVSRLRGATPRNNSTDSCHNGSLDKITATGQTRAPPVG